MRGLFYTQKTKPPRVCATLVVGTFTSPSLPNALTPPVFFSPAGFFSSQVIERAIGAFSVELHSITSEAMQDAKANPSAQKAYICWLSSHWFTIRKVRNQDTRSFSLLLSLSFSLSLSFFSLPL